MLKESPAMPVRPQPRTYRCTTCGWSKTVAPRSDALMPGEHFSECPRCANTDLQCEKSLSATGWLSEVVRGLGR
jgi:predicted RNA-binding Zn-ribbon protein involved in translation (DUF1610 family)